MKLLIIEKGQDSAESKNHVSTTQWHKSVKNTRLVVKV
jgi:hypothetical protein